MKIYSYDSGKQKQILAGEIQEVQSVTKEKYFYKDVKPQHFVRIKQAYGISCDVIDKLIEEGVSTIVIRTPAWHYFSAIENWLNRDLMDDMGNGPQIFLPVQFMKQEAAL
jgi:hypothetical protein